jgi:hypothetical protein
LKYNECFLLIHQSESCWQWLSESFAKTWNNRFEYPEPGEIMAFEMWFGAQQPLRDGQQLC